DQRQRVVRVAHDVDVAEADGNVESEPAVVGYPHQRRARTEPVRPMTAAAAKPTSPAPTSTTPGRKNPAAMTPATTSIIPMTVATSAPVATFRGRLSRVFIGAA